MQEIDKAQILAKARINVMTWRLLLRTAEKRKDEVCIRRATAYVDFWVQQVARLCDQIPASESGAYAGVQAPCDSFL